MNAPKPLERHLRVERVDAGHRDWPAVRRHLGRAGGADRLRHVGPHLSARQAVVAAFLGGRCVGHAAFSVHPVAGRGVVVRPDSWSVDAPFAGTTVEHLMMAVARAGARTMGCRGGPPAAVPVATRAA